MGRRGAAAEAAADVLQSKADAGTVVAPKTDPEGGTGQKKKEGKGSSAPRPRKWDYGIADEAKIKRVLKEDGAKPAVKGDVKASWDVISDNMSCASYIEAGGTRSGLRRMSRRGIISITGSDGTVYPKEYIAPEKPDEENKEAEENS